LKALEALRHPFFREDSIRYEYIAYDSWVGMYMLILYSIWGLEIPWMIVHTAHRGKSFSSLGNSLAGHVLDYRFSGNGLVYCVLFM
jgi:hypothetical protein